MSTEDRNNGEPMAKRVRGLLDYENPEDDKLIQSAEVVQVEIERIIEQETREVSRVQNMYAQKRLEVYARRRKFLEMVPQFWLGVVCAVFTKSFLMCCVLMCCETNSFWRVQCQSS